MRFDSIHDFAETRARVGESVQNALDAFRASRDVLPVDEHPDLMRQIEAVEDQLVRLDAGQFKVGVVGQMNAGKSTLLNALLFGEEVMSSDPNPHTAKLTEIRSGSVPSATVHYYSAEEWKAVLGSLDPNVSQAARALEEREGATRLRALCGTNEQVSIAAGASPALALRPYVAVPHAKRNPDALTPIVRNVDLAFPLRRWPAETVWVDTPGTNDPVAARSQVTLDKLGDLDAVLVVLYALQPLNRADLHLLAEQILPTGVHDLFILINQADQLSESDSTENLQDYVTGMLDKHAAHLPDLLRHAMRTAPVYPVSGMAALVARSEGRIKDGEFYSQKVERRYGSLAAAEEGSGLPRFERDLSAFLARQKGGVLLKAPLDRAAQVASAVVARLQSAADRMRAQLIDQDKSVAELQSEIRDINIDIARYDSEISNMISTIKTLIQNRSKKIYELATSILDAECDRFYAKAKAHLAMANVWTAPNQAAMVQVDLNYMVLGVLRRIRVLLQEEEQELIAAIRDHLKNTPPAVREALSRVWLAHLRIELPTSLPLDTGSLLTFWKRVPDLQRSFSNAIKAWDDDVAIKLKDFKERLEAELTTPIQEATSQALTDLRKRKADKNAAIAAKQDDLDGIASRRADLTAMRTATEVHLAHVRAHQQRLLAESAFFTAAPGHA